MTDMVFMRDIGFFESFRKIFPLFFFVIRQIF